MRVCNDRDATPEGNRVDSKGNIKLKTAIAAFQQSLEWATLLGLGLTEYEYKDMPQ